MDFTAFDVETANSDLASICQIGVVAFSNGTVRAAWNRLVNPGDWFDPLNISIHGITPKAVESSPTFPELFAEMQELLSGQIVVCHTPFDRISVARAVEKHNLSVVPCQWLDVAKVVRRAWPDCARSGYGLGSITKKLGITFKHHDAHEDARAVGEVLIRAMAISGKTLDEWIIDTSSNSRTRSASKSAPIARDGRPDGPLVGEVIVFTGALSISRTSAAELAARAGCNVDERVTKRTTYLVVGDQDIRVLNGCDKSSKHRKAEDLIAKGQHIRILAEGDFQRLIALDGE